MRLYSLLFLAAAYCTTVCLADDIVSRDPSRPSPLPPEKTGDYGIHEAVISRQAGVGHEGPARRAPTPSLPVAPVTAPTVPPSPAPTPMDLQLSYALSNSCLTHLSTSLSSSTFLSCLPFSLLLTTSTGFSSLLSTSTASDDYTTLNSLLAYVTSPRPSGAECDRFMLDAYTKMGDKSACGTDLTAKKGVGVGSAASGAVGAAVEARTGLGNAALMRTAVGLKNPDTGSYCYLEAVASDRPDDLYLWSLPANIALPPSTKPTCSKCSSLLLNQLASATPSSAPALNATLVNRAIGTVNSACGQSFAQYSVPPPSSSASPGPPRPTMLLVVVLGLAMSMLVGVVSDGH